ncbi:DUF1801 domain-containing protein [Paenibacillus radicis (ex Gao et al. 2016)]|uniref:YdhG-like domain-containing protein n=1 Tax=Paenibacillus radicis (ex Gao et al. 2016) TaxID=1737354 RepID=A0A917H1C9_9BACL|nr:DUF1801 domain-containing protein [Paenibacillus radicis (ex Gao et al. 2016)]GGG64441.1 hypothetical protein GCM10010918_18130 [Paenibacillus radicis (ex Gao et al. 2016)]
MNQDVTDFINAVKEPWQAELCSRLRATVHETIPDFQERMQYKKPHFLNDGKYAAVISTSKEAVSFTIFNTSSLKVPEGLFDGPPERKTMKLRKDQQVDFELLSSLLRQAAATLT